MAQFHPAWLAEQRRRWTRHDAHLWVRPDAYRFRTSGKARATGKDVAGYSSPASAADQTFQTNSTPTAPAQLDPSAAIAAEIRAIRDLQYELAKIKFEIKYQRLLRELRSLKYGYNPNQPRVPAGNPDGGEWTRVAGPFSGRSGGRYGGNFPGATYGQLLRLDRAIGRTEDLISQIRRFDPNWRPKTVSVTRPDSIDGAIGRAQARAQEAQAYLDKLRSGIGGNL